MGGSILPICFINSELHFLFGKERDIDENPGWSDFGGGSEPNESFLQTACREGSEEFSGFLGDYNDVKMLLKKNGYMELFWKPEDTKRKGYMVHLVPMVYNPFLLEYFNHSQKLMHEKLSPQIIKDSKIFEKTEIRWFSFSEIKRQKKIFRNFYQNIIQLIINNEIQIIKF